MKSRLDGHRTSAARGQSDRGDREEVVHDAASDCEEG